MEIQPRIKKGEICSIKNMNFFVIMILAVFFFTFLFWDLDAGLKKGVFFKEKLRVQLNIFADPDPSGSELV